MQKIALNKYEQYLTNQPKDRHFSDPRVQRAFVNLQRAKTQNKNAEGIKMFGDRSPANNDAVIVERVEAAGHVRKNRGAMYESDGLRVMSPFSTRKDKAGNELSNDDLRVKNFTKKVQIKDDLPKGTMPPEKNKFFQKAKALIKRNPGKSALIGLGAAGLIGTAAYGIKKNLEN